MTGARGKSASEPGGMEIPNARAGESAADGEPAAAEGVSATGTGTVAEGVPATVTATAADGAPAAGTVGQKKRSGRRICLTWRKPDGSAVVWRGIAFSRSARYDAVAVAEGAEWRWQLLRDADNDVCVTEAPWPPRVPVLWQGECLQDAPPPQAAIAALMSGTAEGSSQEQDRRPPLLQTIPPARPRECIAICGETCLGLCTVAPEEVGHEVSDGEDNADDDEPATAEDVEDIVLERQVDDWQAIVNNAELGFQRGHVDDVRHVTQLRGRDLVALSELGESTVTRLAEDKLRPGTRAAHRRALAMMADIPLVLHGVRAAKVLIMMMTRRRVLRSWRWTSMAKNMATLQGAMKALPLYRNTTRSIALMDDAEWAAAMAAVQAKARSETARVPKAVTAAQIERAAMIAGTPEPMRILLLLAWCLAARIGDLTKLKLHDIVWHGQDLVVTWRSGKTISARGPFTVAVQPPPAWRQQMERYFDRRQAERAQWLFPKELTTAEVLRQLRRVDTMLECRSIRRGAIQTMATAGIPEPIIMMISGHTQPQTLKRYLNWGRQGLLALEQMTEASKELFRTIQLRA